MHEAAKPERCLLCVGLLSVRRTQIKISPVPLYNNWTCCIRPTRIYLGVGGFSGRISHLRRRVRRGRVAFLGYVRLRRGVHIHLVCLILGHFSCRSRSNPSSRRVHRGVRSRRNREPRRRHTVGRKIWGIHCLCSRIGSIDMCWAITSSTN